MTNRPMRRANIDLGFRWRSGKSTVIAKMLLSDSEIKSVEALPVRIEDGDPQLCDKKSGKFILDYISVLSRFVGGSLTIEDGRGILGASGLTG